MSGSPPTTRRCWPTAAGPLELILFDRVIGADWSWSQRDAAMAGTSWPPPAEVRARSWWRENAHAPTGLIEPGVPVGVGLAGQRPGIQEIRISHRSGSFYNGKPRQLAHRTDSQGKIRLYQHHGKLLLDLPLATEEIVAQRPQPWSRMRKSS